MTRKIKGVIMKSVIVAMFVVLGLQSAHAANDYMSCEYKGKDGGHASFKFDDDLIATGTASVILNDGSELELPIRGTSALGDKDGYIALVITWGSMLETFTAALPMAADVVSGPAYSITSFGADGPKGALKGTLTCTVSQNILHALNVK
jgi:hypothetical protein